LLKVSPQRNFHLCVHQGEKGESLLSLCAVQFKGKLADDGKKEGKGQSSGEIDELCATQAFEICVNKSCRR